MPTFLETVGFIAYLSVMSGGGLNRDLLAATYARTPEERPKSYRGVKGITLVAQEDDYGMDKRQGEAAA